MLIDSHCHLDFPELSVERSAVLDRAREAGVRTMLTICTKITEFDRIRSIAESDPDIWCTVGIHPQESHAEPATDAARLVALTEHPKVIGIGECGLDYHYEEGPRETQHAVFRSHLEAARTARVPIVVHTREADDDTARLLSDASQGGDLTGVLHCFTSSLKLALHALDLGFYISFSGIVTFKNAEALRDVVRAVPLERMLVETDAPFLAPVPKRGKRNEPAFVTHTAAALAQIKGVSSEEIAAITSANFHRLFTKAVPAAS